MKIREKEKYPNWIGCLVIGWVQVWEENVRKFGFPKKMGR